jgi:NAD(P)-dependent dehydrogenase (short-subunit alcohol dehydrogenase family)
MTQQTPVALITGASSGIGAATARHFATTGIITYATARQVEKLHTLTAVGCHALQLDVTDENSMRAAVAEIERQHGAVDVLVNNAGYGEMGAIEEVTIDAWRRQFETNVFGLVRLTQLVLPGMRGRGRGRIINVGSGGGEFTFPLGGAYHASKYALEAISDALRFEVAPFGIVVVLIQPSPVHTPLAAATLESIRTDADSPYAPLVAAFRQLSEATAASGSGYLTPEAVAVSILSAAQSRSPRTRYKLGSVANALSAARQLLPDRWWDGWLRRMY